MVSNCHSSSCSQEKNHLLVSLFTSYNQDRELWENYQVHCYLWQLSILLNRPSDEKHLKKRMRQRELPREKKKVFPVEVRAASSKDNHQVWSTTVLLCAYMQVDVSVCVLAHTHLAHSHDNSFSKRFMLRSPGRYSVPLCWSPGIKFHLWKHLDVHIGHEVTIFQTVII